MNVLSCACLSNVFLIRTNTSTCTSTRTSTSTSPSLSTGISTSTKGFWVFWGSWGFGRRSPSRSVADTRGVDVFGGS